MLTQSEPFVRAAVFVSVLVLLLAWQKFAPRKREATNDRRRIVTNLALAFMNLALVRAIVPLGLAAWALDIQRQGWGLLNSVAADRPDWYRIAVALLVLDLTLYVQHVMFHKVPLFWRLHKVHHADTVLDVTTGIRFHPVEIVLSLFLKGGMILFLGAPPAAVVTFEILLNATTLFNHTNGALRKGVDRVLRWFVVTPDMHRIHHSTVREETDSNFGFNIPWWDRLFGTYRHVSSRPLETMDIGLAEVRDSLGVARLLRLPLDPAPPRAMTES